MKVRNMTSRNGNKVANQFITVMDDGTRFFQSYDSVICCQSACGTTELDQKYWDYSRTTAKYRNMFLGEDTKTIKAKIASGEYILTNLN